jgi:succinyl-CoA:(S)-malate CoA-transferase subunit A/succinyl-CoA:(S)-malate CoA-transferase subunit B|tara:strand:+ start:1253 stop:2464 length:1212 start_codon:yes stop_codon:yes gene_type:complete
MAENRDLPLTGVRVLDAATFIAAPFTATILGEFGAEVIKVERPDGGDPFRRFGTATERDDSTLAWLSESRNKKSVTLDLKQAGGQALFKRLAAKSDVICENFRPGTLEKWGLGWDQLSRENPGLVLLRITGYGQTGPYKDRPGFARVAHAVGGLTHLSGHPGETPVTPGSTSLGDYISGLYGAIGVMMALRHRDQTGRGQVIDLGLYESVFRMLDEIAPAYAKTGFVREPEGTGTINACPHGHFPTRDGKWVALACTTDKMFLRLCEAMGKDGAELAKAFGEQKKRLAGRDEVNKRVGDWTGAMDRDALMAVCLEFEVPAGPINTIADIFDDPQFQARGDLTAVAVAGLGEVVVPSPLPKLSQTPAEIRSLGPGLGEHNEDVYGGLLGLSAEQLEKLRKDGVV